MSPCTDPTDGPLVRAIADAAAADERIEVGSRELREPLVELATQTLDRLQAEGRLQVPDTGAMALALTLMNEAYLLETFGTRPSADPEAALKTLQTIWLRTLGSRP
jgi:hypothetical protein